MSDAIVSEDFYLYLSHDFGGIYFVKFIFILNTVESIYENSMLDVD